MHGMYAGWHLTYDATIDPEHAMRLNDVEFLRETLTVLAGRLGMEILDGPRLHKVELDPRKLETEDDEGGVRGVALLTTSHASIHTWPLRARFSLDIFSCRKFDYAAVEEFISERMNVKRRASRWLTRNWP